MGRVIDMRLDDLLEDESLNVEKDKVKGELGFGEKVGIKQSAMGKKANDISPIDKHTLIDFAEEKYEQCELLKKKIKTIEQKLKNL